MLLTPTLGIPNLWDAPDPAAPGAGPGRGRAVPGSAEQAELEGLRIPKE